MVFST